MCQLKIDFERFVVNGMFEGLTMSPVSEAVSPVPRLHPHSVIEKRTGNPQRNRSPQVVLGQPDNLIQGFAAPVAPLNSVFVKNHHIALIGLLLRQGDRKSVG